MNKKYTASPFYVLLMSLLIQSILSAETLNSSVDTLDLTIYSQQGKIRMSFAPVPPGSFIMGSPDNENGRQNMERQHEVHFSKQILVQTTEVTQFQWKTVMGDNPSLFAGCDDCPVENVTWAKAQEFVQKLNALDHNYPYQVSFRLPTESEWEYAARAGSQTAYSFGPNFKTGCEIDTNLDRGGWHCANASSKTHPVAQKQANGWGLYDMHGNVWEWCSDFFGDYPTSVTTDPPGPLTGNYRVLRGGAYYSQARYCRSATRSLQGEQYQGRGYGLRLVVSTLFGQTIPLHSGWNLISFGVNKCFYINAKPTVNMIEGIEYIQVNSIRDVLHSIDGQYSQVRAFDCTGAKFYTFGSPYGDMEYMAAGYGYWIFINPDSGFDENGLIYLNISGEIAPSDAAIQLHCSPNSTDDYWALTGVLGNTVKYVEMTPGVDFPIGVTTAPVNHLKEIFNAIDGQYSYIKSQYKDGEQEFFYDNSQVNDLKCVGPGYGYMIKLNAGQAYLVW